MDQLELLRIGHGDHLVVTTVVIQALNLVQVDTDFLGDGVTGCVLFTVLEVLHHCNSGCTAIAPVVHGGWGSDLNHRSVIFQHLVVPGLHLILDGCTDPYVGVESQSIQRTVHEQVTEVIPVVPAIGTELLVREETVTNLIVLTMEHLCITAIEIGLDLGEGLTGVVVVIFHCIILSFYVYI